MNTKKAEQVLNRFIDFYRDVRKTSDYRGSKKDILEEINSSETDIKIEILQKKLSELEIKNKELNDKINFGVKKENDSIIKDSKEIIELSNQKVSKKEKTKINKIEEKEKNKNLEINKIENKKVKNLVKNVEYTSVDQKGNKFYLIARSGKSNVNNNDILDLDNVKGEITSETRDTIYIESDYAQYNTVSLNSQFYQNVIINYQDKEITCINFDINMETNKAIAYNNVIITDPKSTMKAGIVEFDLKTKNININPESSSSEVNIISN